MTIEVKLTDKEIEEAVANYASYKAGISEQFSVERIYPSSGLVVFNTIKKEVKKDEKL